MKPKSMISRARIKRLKKEEVERLVKETGWDYCRISLLLTLESDELVMYLCEKWERQDEQRCKEAYKKWRHDLFLERGI